MAERRTRRSFTREFKAQAVKRLLDGGKGLSEVATELGIGTGQLSQWRTEHLAAGSVEALAVRKAEQAETQRLKREVKRLEEEVEILRKAAAFFQGDRVTKFAFVSAERANHAVATLCRVIGASVSGFYAWLHAIPTVQSRAEAEAALREQIGRVFAARRRVYGSPRVHAELRREGRRHSRRRIERLMREMGLSARRGRRRTPRTTDSRHDLPVAPNLLARNFTADRPDQVWLADISYIPTDEGFLYLAAIKDMATREIVGWSMADHLRAELCIGALVMAIQRHRPSRGLVHHGDRGVQYASEPYRAVLERHGITQSMSRRGNCLDNAPMESFFASLKTEHVHQVRFRTREEAKTAVFEYIEIFYNRQRLHSAIGYRTPAEARASMEGITMRAAA
ncbi:MAG TPA: IS3 family transposase [Candidatus Limnocylindria bacterium]|nr:IS3 family transposase [Candidatus Limnocylindria bacterium]